MAYEYDEGSKTLSEALPLVTRAEVLLICKEIDDDTPVAETTAFIATAHVILCNVLDGYGIPASLLKNIEKYLAAHFANLTYSSVSRQGLGPMTTTFLLKIDLGFNATRYGQMAMTLDPTGMLENFRRKRVKMVNLGSGESTV